MPLSDMACRKAKPKDKIYKLSDSGGLCLRVTSRGGKYWVFRYRFGGKQKDLSLGVYPKVSLAQARGGRDRAKEDLCAGVDPALVKITAGLALREASDTSFESVAIAWLEHRENKLTSPKYTKQVAARLEGDIFPRLGKLPINTITPPQILAVLRKVEERGVFETSRRLKQYCGMIFRYAIALGLAERDPTADLKGVLMVPAAGNYATIESDELPAFLKAMANPAHNMSAQTRFALQLLMLTFVRTGELIGARWDEFQLDQKTWVIPAARMKMGRDHIVPLSSQAHDILKMLRKITGGALIFPSHKNAKKTISNNTILQAIGRMGYRGRMTGHGFRALAMTTLREKLDYPFDVIDLQLAHAPRNKIKAAYDRAKFLKERRKMMQDWANYIDKIEKAKVK